MLVGVALVAASCSGSRDVDPIGGPTSTTTSTTSGAGTGTSPATSAVSAATSAGGTATPASSTARPTTSTAATTEVTIVAVAGTTGPVQPGGPPFPTADPFTETVRLEDRTCVGWAGSNGGSTQGLEVGARVVILHARRNEEIGVGTIRRSRWADVSGGGRQWNCFFEFTTTVTGAPREFRIRVAGLQPWLASPDPSDPATFVASVSTGADIGLIPSCPAVPNPDATTTTTRRPVRRSSTWHAIGEYWSRGVASLCRAGLPVTAIARPCRPPRVGSEYISEVVDSNDSTVTYRDGVRIPVGTQVTVVVATGHPCG
jgi:hypothetical protein